jgi:hypothetical protein
MISRKLPLERTFQFERDTFAFPNELVWEYRLDPSTGTMNTFRNVPRPNYAHRCFVLVRSCRQFFYHARFDPKQPKAETAQYQQLIRQVVSRSPRQPSPEIDLAVIPGYDCLREFSQAQEALLKAECGGAWQSYFLRSHWRMTLPITRRQQEQMARQLLRAFTEKPTPIVHLVRFPQLTINHGIVLFDFSETDFAIQFQAYDPNTPAHPVELIYQRADRTFYFPRNHYWPGGKLDVIEVYRGWFY